MISLPSYLSSSIQNIQNKHIYIYKYDVCTFNVDYTMAQYLLLLFHVVFFSWYPRLEAYDCIPPISPQYDWKFSHPFLDNSTCCLPIFSLPKMDESNSDWQSRVDGGLFPMENPVRLGSLCWEYLGIVFC